MKSRKFTFPNIDVGKRIVVQITRKSGTVEIVKDPYQVVEIHQGDEAYMLVEGLGIVEEPFANEVIIKKDTK